MMSLQPTQALSTFDDLPLLLFSFSLSKNCAAPINSPRRCIEEPVVGVDLHSVLVHHPAPQLSSDLAGYIIIGRRTDSREETKAAL